MTNSEPNKAAEFEWRKIERSNESAIVRLMTGSKLIADLFSRIRELEARPVVKESLSTADAVKLVDEFAKTVLWNCQYQSPKSYQDRENKRQALLTALSQRPPVVKESLSTADVRERLARHLYDAEFDYPYRWDLRETQDFWYGEADKILSIISPEGRTQEEKP